MPRVNVKKVRDRVTLMNTAWAQGAPGIAFKGVKQVDFQADIQAAAAVEQETAALEAQIKIKNNERDTRYQKLSDDSVKIRDGVEGHESYGPDHSLYEAMGFVRESARKSGLTRNKKQPASTKT